TPLWYRSRTIVVKAAPGRRTPRRRLTSWVAEGVEVGGDFVNHCRILNRWWHAVLKSIGDLLDRAAHDLPRTSLRQTLNYGRRLERSHWPNPLAPHLDQFGHDLHLRSVDTSLQHDQSERNFTFQFVSNTNHRAFSHVCMRRQHFLQRSSRKPMPGHI